MSCLLSILYNTFNHTINSNIGNIVSAVKPFSLGRSGKTHFSRPAPNKLVLEEIFVRPAEVPAHLWGKVLFYERKLRGLIGELKEYSA